eukprot:scaffold272676_cov18-Tisochrysis_lutea.AAC.1
MQGKVILAAACKPHLKLCKQGRTVLAAACIPHPSARHSKQDKVILAAAGRPKLCEQGRPILAAACKRSPRAW